MAKEFEQEQIDELASYYDDMEPLDQSQEIPYYELTEDEIRASAEEYERTMHELEEEQKEWNRLHKAHRNLEEKKKKMVDAYTVHPKGKPDIASEGSQSLLDEAKRILGMDRRADYGNASESFLRVSTMWSAFLSLKRIPARVTSEDVAILMILFKVCREMYKHKRDNCLDIVGYATLLNEIGEKNNDK